MFWLSFTCVVQPCQFRQFRQSSERASPELSSFAASCYFLLSRLWYRFTVVTCYHSLICIQKDQTHFTWFATMGPRHKNLILGVRIFFSSLMTICSCFFAHNLTGPILKTTNTSREACISQSLSSYQNLCWEYLEGNGSRKHSWEPSWFDAFPDLLDTGQIQVKTFPLVL